MNIKDANKQQFLKMLQKDGQTIICNGQEHKAIVRIVNSKTSQECINIFYSQDSGIKKGDIIEMCGEHFLVNNQRAWDSGIFYMSTCIRTNHTWRILGKTYYMVAGDLSSPNPKSGSVLTTVNGAINLYTTQSEICWIDDTIYDFGGTWKCINKFDIDGLSYYYFTRELDQYMGNYVLKRLNNDVNKVKIGEILNTECYLRYGTKVAETRIAPSVDIKYTSSAPEIADVDQYGDVVGLSNGVATITASTTVRYPQNGFNGFKEYKYTLSYDIEVYGVSKYRDIISVDGNSMTIHELANFPSQSDNTMVIS